MAFASGKKAYGISDRSGFRYRLKDMRKEWNGLLVGKDEFEAKHPQLRSPRVGADPQALRDPRPETGLAEQRALQYGFNPVGFKTIPGIIEENDLVATGGVGTVTVFLPKTLGAQAVGAVGNVNVQLPATVNQALTGSVATGGVASVSLSTNVTTFYVTVANPGSGNVYYVNGTAQATMTLLEGNIYHFDQSDSSNSGHPLRFSTTSDGTHGGGVAYTTGVVTVGTPGSLGSYTEITVASGAPTLYYYCTNHSGMGGQANTP
tara:strand:+ start:163 stop:948 length:786 start_codon:yes stop_codon:yes gene_type:complete